MSQSDSGRTALVDKETGRLLPVVSLRMLFAWAAVIFLIYAFFSGLAIQFYASFLFLFYSWTNRMWVSVVMLGVFQTILMVPFRIVNLVKSAQLAEFREVAEKLKTEKSQTFLKKNFKKGRNVAVYYVVNFVAALVSYTSIGRLFLKDFYSQPLDPSWLYSFVPYPDYPILDRIFKLPYVWFTQTRDFGVDVLWWVWGVIVGLQLLVYIGLYVARKRKALAPEVSSRLNKLATGNLVLFLVISWWLVRHFPVGWRFYIFTGDVAVPNRTLNAVTAIATFVTLVWVNLPKIRHQVNLAEAAGFPAEVIRKTSKELLSETLRVAAFVGLGAYFITNLIPSAFELSIFTLELISLTAPLTLDKLILRGVGKQSLAKEVADAHAEVKPVVPAKKEVDNA